MKEMMSTNNSQNNHNSHSEKKMPCKTVVVTDYVNRKIIVIYTSESKQFYTQFDNIFIVIEVDLIVHDQPYLRYNEGSSILIEIEDGFEKDQKGLKYYIEQLFESGLKFDAQTLMISEEYKNIIRDHKQVICFLENQINDK